MRIFYKYEEINIVINSIVKSLYGISNVLIFVLIIWLFYAIIGIQLFKNKFGYCQSPENMNVNMKNCKYGNWVVHQNNFDDIFNALLTLYIVSTFDHLGTIITVATNSNFPENVYFLFLFFNIYSLKNVYIFYIRDI